MESLPEGFFGFTRKRFSDAHADPKHGINATRRAEADTTQEESEGVKRNASELFMQQFSE